jgi:hypothetical protein
MEVIKNNNSKSRFRVGIMIMLLLLISFYYLYIYPSISDFCFWHMTSMLQAKDIGRFNLGSGMGGNDFLVAFITYICNIPYDTFILQPILLVILAITFITIFKKTCTSNFICLSLVGIYFTQSNYPSVFTWGCHEVGIVLLFIIGLISIMRMEKPQHHIQSSILLIILIISMNFISYKMTFITLCYLTCLGLLNLKNKKKNENFTILILIGLVIVLSFNKFFYNSFLPIIKNLTSYSPTSGIEKLFPKTQKTLLSSFYFENIKVIEYAHVLWLLLIAMALIICSVIVFKKIKNNKISLEDNFFVSCLISSILITITYLMLGLPTFTYIILVGLIGFCFIFKESNIFYKQFVIISILTMMIINIFCCVLSIENNSYIGHRDSFNYISTVSDWYINYNNDQINNKVAITSDVLTSGYFMKEFYINKISKFYTAKIFSWDQMLFLLGKDKSLPCEFNNKFIINYRLQHFSILGWAKFKSWSHFEKVIKRNVGLNFVYTSGSIDIVY